MKTYHIVSGLGISSGKVTVPCNGRGADILTFQNLSWRTSRTGNETSLGPGNMRKRSPYLGPESLCITHFSRSFPGSEINIFSYNFPTREVPRVRLQYTSTEKERKLPGKVTFSAYAKENMRRGVAWCGVGRRGVGLGGAGWFGAVWFGAGWFGAGVIRCRGGSAGGRGGGRRRMAQHRAVRSSSAD